ncbi:MAG: TonB family protein [Thermodesulfobacteriota bacterium]
MNLKFFLSISLGLHLFFLSILYLLFPDFKIDPIQPFHVEVSLLSLISEAKPLPEPITAPAEKTQARREETGAPQKPKEVDPAAQQEKKQERKQEIAALPSAAKDIPLEEPKLLPIEDEKWERGNITLPLPSNSDSTENLSISLPPSYPEKMTRAPFTDSGEMSLTVSRPKPSAEEKTAFAQPRYAENPKPLYPKEAKRKGYQGEVLLRVEVLANGRVGRVEVKKSSGHEVLDRSALGTVKEWKFTPASQGNGAIPCWVNIPIKFQLQ